MGAPAKACMMVSANDGVTLAKTVLKAGMGKLNPDSRVPRDCRGRPVVAGWVCVPHKTETDRLIMDRRPENSWEIRLPTQPLRNPSQFVRLIVPKGCGFRGSSDDLSCCFYSLKRQPPGGSNCVRRALSGRDFADVDPCLDPNGLYRLQI